MMIAKPKRKALCRSTSIPGDGLLQELMNCTRVDQDGSVRSCAFMAWPDDDAS